MAAEVEAEADESVQYPAFYKVMMDKLNEQRQLDQFTDITLIVDGHQFRAHKAVLAACSQFFHKFFQDFTQEPLVEIEGVSNTAFRQLMEFTYTATLSVTGDDEAQDAWKAAEYLQMQEALKALESRTHEKSSVSPKRKGKKRKIAETSNVITETLPLVEGEQVEIEVIGEEAIEEEVVDAVKSSQDDSALALLADITSKYQHGESTMHVIKKGELEEEIAYQEETVTASKVLENVEVVEVQISQVDNMFRCDKCDRSFKLYYFLKQHLKTHTGSLEKPHVCNHCGKAYTREGALKQHVTTFHSEAEELNKNQKPQKKMHVCEYCQKNFDHFGHFKEHLRKHTGEKPYECPDCHERFARNSTLKCHMTACQNGVGAKKGRKKIYECQVCNSVFNVWEEFKDHLVSHTGDKPNHCTVCDVWFTHSKDLSEHLRDTHNIDDPKTGDDLLVPDPSLALSAQSMEAGETVVLEEGIHMDIMETATVMVDEQGVAEMCEEDVERLKRAGVEIQVVQVNSSHMEEVGEVEEVEGEVVTVEQVQEEVTEEVTVEDEDEEQGAVI